MALTRRHVVVAALQLVNDEGLDALTLRALATRLEVKAPTLYWHVKNKAELLDALADAIMDEALAAIRLDSDDWPFAALGELRTALLAHRDGARVVSGARASLRRADFTELVMFRLVESGIELQRARLVVLAAERYTVGYVLEEQSPPPQHEPDLEELQRRLPTATKAIIDYFSAGRTSDDLYAEGLRLILR